MTKKLIRFSTWLRNFFLFLVFLLILGIGGRLVGIIIHPEELRVADGTIDFSQRPLQGHEVVNLNGDWEVYWQQFLYPESSGKVGGPDLYGRVPEVWNTYAIDGEDLPGFGSASYRLVMEGVPVGVPLAFRLDSVSTAYEMYVDGELKASNGRISHEPGGHIPENKPQWFYFEASEDTVEVVVQVSNHLYARGGIWYPIQLGTLEGIKQLENRILLKDGLLIGSLLVMAIYHSLFFLILKDVRKSLVVILLCGVAVLRISLYGSYQIFTVYPELPYELLVRLNYFTLLWFPALLYTAFKELFFDRSRLKKEWLLNTYTTIMTLLIAITPVSEFTAWIHVMEAVIIVVAFRALWLYFKAIPVYRTGLLVMIGGFLVFAMSVHDMLLQDNKIVSPLGELTSVGVVIQMFLISISTSYDSLESYRIRKQLKEELQESREKQEQLEKHVMNRHHQLTEDKNQKPNIGLVTVNEFRYEEVKSRLSPCGYHVVRIEDSLDGFSILLQPEPVNLLVLDVRDNPRQGLNSLKQLRELIPKEIMPVILISEIGQENYIAEGLTNGASDFLTMPFKPWELKTRVKNLIYLSVSSEKLLASQLMFLQAQIKPHFLFNTLSVLASMAEVNPPMTKQLIHDLADYLRGGIDFESTTGIIRLSREIGIVKAYVSIEQARFRDRINSEFYLEGDLEVEVPLLTIQPLVENAIRHGILPKTETGKVLVSVVNDGHRVVIEVKDDGIGMAPEEVERIKRGIAVSESGIGLSNIQRRLQVLFGSSLSIESVQGRGTAVSFSILARKEVKPDESAGR